MNTGIYIGNNPLHFPDDRIVGEYVSKFGEEMYVIRNYDQMPPFFMTLVSSSDLWMFISSTGGLTAGRSNSESALFPYYTDDKVTENYTNTGPLTMIKVSRGNKTVLWEPFSDRYSGIYQFERNIYKNITGNKLVFEEQNFDLGLVFKYAWRTSDRYGFVKTAWLRNETAESCSLNVVDGLQNMLPYGATTALQSTFSNLLNGYKRNELERETGVGIFSLSSTLTDMAEPSESLKATTAWQYGLQDPCCFLSTAQIKNLRFGAEVCQEIDVRGYRGAYLLSSSFDLPKGEEKEWSIVADVNQDHSDITSLINGLKRNPENVKSDLEQDIVRCNAELVSIVAQADGLQISSDRLSISHHFANVLFNTMRGGIFANQYSIDVSDLVDFMNKRNAKVTKEYSDFFSTLPASIHYEDLINKVKVGNSRDLERLCLEYLPLTFSRRHGDPSRPWNHFSINVKKLDGSKRLDYQGNWNL